MQTVFLKQAYDWKNLSLSDFLKEGNTPSLWKDFFQSVETELDKISENLEKVENVIYPPINKVFCAFNIDISNIKVLVLGQDPYHDGNAVGLCFIVPGNQKVNPSLRNIYTELEKEGHKNSNIYNWKKQGCFMLNTSLTVEKANPGSHLKLWKEFTKKLLNYISENGKNIAWLLMGKHASKFKNLTYKNGHKAFITSHPSPLSAYKKFENYPAFIGSNVFNEINNFLEKKIVW